MANWMTNSLRIESADGFAMKAVDEATYVFIGRNYEWADEELPPCVEESAKFIDKTFKDMIGVKRIQFGDSCSVARRYNWTRGQIYDAFDDTINMVDNRKRDNSPYIFYVMNSEYNVYKCINNQNGKTSIVEPTGTSLDYIRTADGYSWKFMYAIDMNDTARFMTSAWMPIYTKFSNDGSAQWQVQQGAKGGTINNVIVVDGGTGYIASNAPTVTIEGDGQNATATIEINPVDRKIININITNPGEGYTFANIKLSGTNQTAVLRAVVTPTQGHGHDARVELGGTYLMFAVALDGDEGGNLPVTEYRQTGIVKGLMTKTTSVAIRVSVNDSYQMLPGQMLRGSQSAGEATVMYSDVRSGYVYVNMTKGNFAQQELVITTANKHESVVEEIVQNATLPAYQVALPATSLKIPSGGFLYIVNRTKIIRNSTQKETAMMILSF